MPTRGSAHIQFDANSQDVTGVYFGGDTTNFELTTSLPSVHAQAMPITVNASDTAGKPYNFGLRGNSIVILSSFVAPFNYTSDSGSATITHFAGDSLIGSLSVRLTGSDSSVHHLSMSFVASSPFPID